MAFADAFEIRHFQTYYSQAILNVYHVEKDIASPAAVKIGEAFEVTMLPLIRAVQINTLTHGSLAIESLSDPTDFAGRDLGGVAGTRTGDPMNSFVAWGIRLLRTTQLVRHGQKRISGCADADVTNGVIAAGTITTAMNNLLAGLVADWLDAVPVLICHQVVIKRVQYSPPGGGVAYRLPVDAGEYLSYRPLEATLSRVTSQVSRKAGF